MQQENLEVTFSEKGSTKEATAAVISKGESLRKKIRQTIQDSPGITPRELQKKLGIGREIYYHLRKMEIWPKERSAFVEDLSFSSVKKELRSVAKNIEERETFQNEIKKLRSQLKLLSTFLKEARDGIIERDKRISELEHELTLLKQ